ncbi:xanthine dehydrogenase/oxidase-like [Bombyx mandarina]|uniref:Xanthine dehydrogenase/oxidase-like n=1 Tax=Bombyx mandarina TaxID=7092 RepID=A0A6J2JUQ7_BOMMA|nr:xanthine dehydrogenase/oxidase-like [Bombyx mandarina]
MVGCLHLNSSKNRDARITMAKIEFTINGSLCKVDESIPRYMSLNAYIRYVCGLTGTKAMCREGGCGACIVTVRAKRYPSGKTEIFSVNSCLVLVFSCHGWDIRTIESTGNRLDGYSDIQKLTACLHGTQCGYCTPGWIMHLNSLKDKNLTMAQLEKSFGCCTCRCTGFRPILEIIKSVAIDAPPKLSQRLKDIEEISTCAKKCQRKCSVKSDCSDWSLLEDSGSVTKIELDFGKYKFYKVYEIVDIFDILNRDGVDSYMLVDGNTGKGIVETFEYERVLIDISDVMALKTFKIDQNLILGANVSLEDCITIFTEISKTESDFEYLDEVVKHFELIAHIPVRKIASLAGNLMYKRAYPQYRSDVFLLFECLGAEMTVQNSKGNTYTLRLEEFLHHDMQGIVIVNFMLPPLNKTTHLFKSYKIMPRSQNAMAIVNAAFLMKLDSKNNVQKASIVYGNISSTFVHALHTEEYLTGKCPFSNETLQGAIKTLDGELVSSDNPAEASPDCRKKLALGLFYKFMLSICPTASTESIYRSGANIFTRPVSEATQDYVTDSSLYPLNQPVPKLEALIQCSGEARYVNDLPPQKSDVFGAFVLSTVHSGEVDKIYENEILEIEGVLAIYTAKDIPGENTFITPGLQLQTDKEETLATIIKYFGQPIAIVVAETEELAAAVAKKVRVDYKNTKKSAPVITIDEAKKDSSRYIAGEGTLEPTSKGTDVTKIIKGVYEIEAQYHYYMEPLTCVVQPVDDMFMVYDSTQWMEMTQTAIARCLNIGQSKIVVKVPRVGGAFGGKITRNGQVAAACALVASKQNRTCRFILPLQTNMSIAGKRLPCQCEYEVGVNDDGKIQYLNATIVEDAGCCNNDNVTSYTSSSFGNCYDISGYTLNTATVLTDLPSNTFFRAPGACEGIACIEHIMEHIAFAVKKDAISVRLANMKANNTDIPEMIETLKQDVDYDKRCADIQQFNKDNRWVKRAIKINVMEFPVIYYGNFTVMISIYRMDGTVTITTGGIEMGQGANTKAAQVCANALGIPLDVIKVISHYSFVAANDVFSGSSITTESICYCILKICETFDKRFAPVKSRKPQATWLDIVKSAAEEGIELTSCYMMSDKDESLSGYSAFAVSIVEIQLDVLTGRFQMLRVDLLEDVGMSVNPAVDIGQVEGAFIQGVGYFTCEKLVYDKATGKLLTNRSLTYHVPLCQDIPIVYNVKLRHNQKNTKGVLGAKTCGEMGICTAHGITLALRECIMASRIDSGYDSTQWITIPVPYDTEAILKALDVKLEEFVFTASD